MQRVRGRGNPTYGALNPTGKPPLEVLLRVKPSESHGGEINKMYKVSQI